MGVEGPQLRIPQTIILRLFHHPSLTLNLIAITTRLQNPNKRSLEHYPSHAHLETQNPILIIPKLQLCHNRA